jgi:hypothetical protein
VTTLPRSANAARRWLLPAIVLAGLAGADVVGALKVPPSDGDLGWQHWLGVQILSSGLPHALGAESFTAAGAPWVPQEWLFSALLALAVAHGLGWLFALAVGTCAILALGCVALRCARYGAHPAAVAFVLIFVDVAMSQTFGVRVQVVGWAMLAAFLLALELPGRLRWTAVVIAVLWANCHASAVLAPVLAAAAAAGSAAQGDRRGAARDAVLALFSAIAVCATPLGTRLPLYALELAHSPIRHWIREWRPTALGDSAFAFGALPLIALAALAAFAVPRSRRAIAIAAPFAYLTLVAVRNVPLAAIACAPLAAVALTSLLPSLASLRPIRNRAVATAAIVAAFLTVGTANAIAARSVHDERPLIAIAQLARLPGRHRLLCEDFAWCGPAVDTGRVGVFVDGRADPFPPSVWTQYDTIIHVRKGWRLIVRRYGVDALLVHRGGTLDRAAERDGWHIAVDAPIRLLVTRSPSPQGRRDS